ncbi:MAG: flavin monoamine oxidase family protein, partial [Dehalococcoidia bacterium]
MAEDGDPSKIPQDNSSKVLDTAIVGAGLAGLTLAYRLKDRDILLLEKEDVCGGRTISRKMGEYVYNAGAQVIIGKESLPAKLADELGVKYTLIRKTKIPIHMKGKLVAASSEPSFLWQLPIPLMEKVKLGLKILGMRRRYGYLSDELADPSDPTIRELDSVTMDRFIGTSHPDVKALWDVLSMGANTMLSHEVAALQPVSTFLHFAGDEHYVEGGTWELTKALWDRVKEKTETSAEVQDVAQKDGLVEVTYDHAGQEKTVRARKCAIAVPGPLVLNMIKDLPDWKRETLSEIDFGAMTSAGFLLGEPSESFLGEGVWRVPVVGKSFISVTNPSFTLPREVKERTGQGLLRVYTGDRVSKR